MSTIARATIKSYDATTHSATVQIAGSLAVWLDAVPVSDGIAPADVVAGRECGVIFFTEDNPSDAAIVTIHNAVPTGWGGSTTFASLAEVTAGTEAAKAIAPLTLPIQVQDSHYVYAASAVGTDAYAITLVPAIGAYAVGQVFHFKADVGNIGAATLNVNGKGAKAIKHQFGEALLTGDIKAGQVVTVVYDGTNFQMQSQQATIQTSAPAGIGVAATSYFGLLVRFTAAAYDFVGQVVDVGGIATGDPTGSSELTGVKGNAVTADATGTVASVYGLDYTVGIANFGANTLPTCVGVRARLMSYNSGSGVISTAAFFRSEVTSVLTISAITTLIGLDLPGSASTKFATVYHVKGGSFSGAGVKYIPFEFDGPARTTDTDGSAHRNNVQFGSLTRKFGGGDGVIGLTYATTNPTANPTGGVIIYADGGTGDFKVRGAAGQICKLPTGGATNVTGSRGGNVALANLLTVLAGLGLIVDGTSP